ncbi:bifunctional protein FolD 1, mitochondrial-like [Ananas comosus]|uniref:Bifunctional protein FolD 1, mitochondrial n=1 Tax=Ananas comosus TaxID=4615 RepID=A0A199UG62_ANACO|nr:bifunctional protein FolD 1, mitochondrial-like [Ananas comosus]OAY63701.1 Bifunctional protein FolD 1, mitochondrial [Ananas comosus]
MRALVLLRAFSRAKAHTLLFSSHCARRHCHAPAKRERAKGPRILGPDLPDIWRSPPLDSTHPPPPLIDANQEINPTIIDGNSIAEEIRSRTAEEVHQMKDAVKKIPGLAVILVGQRRDSQTYVRYKIKACHEVGIRSLTAELPEDCTEDEVVDSVSRFNEDPSVHGILVQLPLPQHMNEERILGAISLEKDVDGFHPLNVGNLAMRGREPLFIPCAARACIELLTRTGIELMGKHVAVIGRSKVVGLPTTLLLQRHHATVSSVHAFTKNPQDITRQADIVISAAGVANLVRGSWLKRGAVVIDVGTNPVEDPSSEHGYHLTGDVCFKEAVKVASAITPVPGGVGPVTIAMLLSNTLDSAKQIYGLNC